MCCQNANLILNNILFTSVVSCSYRKYIKKFVAPAKSLHKFSPPVSSSETHQESGSPESIRSVDGKVLTVINESGLVQNRNHLENVLVTNDITNIVFRFVPYTEY